MASDPRNPNLFTRAGVFEEYDSLRMYYIGMGGNTNATTRFRKYHGDGNKPLLQEYLNKDYLLKPNTDYLITLIVKDGLSEYFVNGKKYFSYKDPEPLTEGYFGFRTTWSRQQISDFKIHSLE
jgi:rhamnogalacturonan endolyase